MSKQLKYKLKKTLKNAEFVHADLEYHQELFAEAKIDFNEEVSQLLKKLPPEEQARLREIVEKKISAEIAQRMGSSEKDEVPEEDPEITASNCMDLITTDTVADAEDKDTKVDLEKSKLIELKRLFRKIAELTHPDKVAASGFSDQEASRLEKVFKRALQAYNDDNWYVVYSIALELQIPLDVESGDYIDWIDEDIRKTLSNISRIGSTVAWIWYVGDESAKNYALKSYFEQIYGYIYPGL
jgi:hypothetical protein|tara:strand:- start:1422 stop:2144 length:723 start_codon:yes stop_codon:yes gene_type:complete